MSSTRSALHLRTPGDLLEAVPYLLGFHPTQSVVLVGLAKGEVAITLRIDLADADPTIVGAIGAGVVATDVARLLRRAVADAVVLVVYDDTTPRPTPNTTPLPTHQVVDLLSDVVEAADVAVADALLVRRQEWWSYVGRAAGCPCCADGNSLPGDESPTAATAVFAGLVAHPDRAALQAVLEPNSDLDVSRMMNEIKKREDALSLAVAAGDGQREVRSVKRALFAAAREADRSLLPAPSPDDGQLFRFAAGLREIAVRDPLWLALEQGRLDGRPLWHLLARGLPPPYDCAPLFLFGWATWREGNGALAAIAAQRALTSDPGYTAADLLLSAVEHGLDPFKTPRLRVPRRLP